VGDQLPARDCEADAHPGRLHWPAAPTSFIGAYDANQAEIFDTASSTAFGVVKAGGQSALIDQLLAPDTRRLPTETGSDMYAAVRIELATDSVAALAASLAPASRAVRRSAALGTRTVLSSTRTTQYPRRDDGHRLAGLVAVSRPPAKLERRFSNGYYYMLGYTLARSKDTARSSAFHTVATGSGQSASSTPFNHLRSEPQLREVGFRPTHVFRRTSCFRLPFGHGKRFGGGVTRVDLLIGGWEVAGALTWQSGRPFTVYSGSNTLRTRADAGNCSGCEVRSAARTTTRPRASWFFDPEARAKFSVPKAGQFSDVGRHRLPPVLHGST